MNKSVTEIILNDIPVEIKSKPDARHTSGWSVIAFTPDISIRSTKLHRDPVVDSFAAAIIGACDAEGNEAEFDLVIEAIKSITA